MANLDAYKPDASNYDFSKGPKEIFNAQGDQGLFDVILNIPQDDQDDEWGGTERVAFERIINEVGSLRFIVKDPLNPGAGNRGLETIVGNLERVVKIGATSAEDFIKLNTTEISDSQINFGAIPDSSILSAGTFTISVKDKNFIFNELGMTVEGNLNVTGGLIESVVTNSLSIRNEDSEDFFKTTGGTIPKISLASLEVYFWR